MQTYTILVFENDRFMNVPTKGLERSIRHFTRFQRNHDAPVAGIFTVEATSREMAHIIVRNPDAALML